MALDIIARAMAAHADGKAVTAYQYAVAGGYTGTEQEFQEEVALMAENAQAVNNAVRFDISQSKTDAQKLQAQANLGLDTSDGSLQDQLDNKANIDGYYSGLTSGQTEQILSNKKSFNKVPYLSRTTGGSADVGARDKVRNVIYGTVIHNQLIPIHTSSRSTTLNGVTFTDNRDGSYTVSTGENGATADAVLDVMSATSLYGHKIYLHGTPSTGSPTTYGLGNYWAGASVLDSGKGYIGNAPMAASSIKIQIVVKSGAVITTPVVFKPQLHDLTQYFGSVQIPNYLAQLETTEAGSGIAQLHQWGFLRRPYYAYDTGTPKSSNPSYKTNTGRQLFDISEHPLENKALNGTSANYLVTTSGYIPIIPSQPYMLSYKDTTNILTLTGKYIHWYDADKNEIGNAYEYTASKPNLLATAPSNAYYARLRWYKSPSLSVADITAAKPVLFVHWDTDYDDDPYADYEEWTYPIDSTVDGHGIFKLDANNNLYIDGDTLAHDGTFTGNYGYYTITGEESFASSSSGHHYINGLLSGADLTGLSLGSNSEIPLMICAFAETKTYYAINVSGDASGVALDSRGYFFIGETEYANWSNLAGKKIYYKLATPTTAQKDPYTETQTCDDWGIQYTNDKAFDDGNSDVEVPVGFDSEFPANLVAKLEMSPESPADGNGDYIVRQTDGQNEYVKLVNELPSDPVSDGTYTLKCTVSGGVVTKSWVADT